jgi:transcriptional regulator with GAF, ATPase, and Fis domain
MKNQQCSDHITAEDMSFALNDVIVCHIQKVLSITNGKIHGPGGAAELLRVNPSTLRNRIKKLGIQYARGTISKEDEIKNKSSFYPI